MNEHNEPSAKTLQERIRILTKLLEFESSKAHPSPKNIDHISESIRELNSKIK